ncbi:MAG TPA: sigma-54-dependent Fis family transcriptional regulator, partial [Proteobacteria bacterium]|nr:sigma-54-dependent Fis family transcriptional regulator [Pseudomonadota bacterium]
GKSPQMREVFRLVEKVSQTGSNVLIAGASGTGKELVARAIHSQGARKGGPFIPVNCAAIPQELLESEFFGHEKGSFTGAHERSIGKFELANRGILFLDEISTLRMELQAKLLRVLQEREFNRVGGAKLIRVDVQIIAATNMDLKNMVASGTFREDLFYRLNVLPITLPPLKDRPGDIPLLVNHFLKDISYRVNRKAPKVTPEALKLLEAYSWPGNARELENVLERMVALSSGEGSIGIEDLPVEIATTEFSSNTQTGSSDSLLEARDRYEKMYVLSALRKTGWNQSEAARLLRIHRNTLLKKMAAFQLSARKEQQ